MSGEEREKSREDSMCNDLFPSAAQNPLHRDFLSVFFTLLLIYLGTLHDGVSFWMFRIPFGIELFVQLSRLAFHFSCCARCSYQSISEEIKCKLIAFLPNFLFSLSSTSNLSAAPCWAGTKLEICRFTPRKKRAKSLEQFSAESTTKLRHHEKKF